MKALKMSQNFTVEDIHNLRLYIADQYSKMSEKEIKKDIQFHLNNAEKTIANFRKDSK
jgi:hypothetical protein